MKRSDALRPLSRQHHAALLVAKALRDASDPDHARLEMLRFWEAGGRDHFRIEEEVLLPRWAAAGAIDDGVVGRFSSEHLDLRARILTLARGTPKLAEVHELGNRLHDHVRFEERVLFPLIENALEEDGLRDLGAAIEEAIGGPPREG